MSEIANREPRIVIVGAGPSGCFIAGALRRALPAARLLVVDRLPCPFGLVRYGVAADHQSTKNITRQFDRIFTKEGVEFAGNVRVTATPEPGAVSLDELAERADAVVLATGLAADRPLGIPGDGLAGVVGAGSLTRVLNTHPDAAHSPTPEADAIASLGQHVAIVGMGNVAVDLVRFLAKPAEGFDGSDVNDRALADYHADPATEITVVSRSSIAHAKCDAQMVRELGQIGGLRVTLAGATDAAESELDDPAARSRVEALRALAEAAQDPHPRVTLNLLFGATPQRVLGESRVTGLRVRMSDGAEREVEATSVISAIGFAADAHSPLSDPADMSGRVRPGLYRVGWCRRGPTGTIPENRADAVAVAAEIASDVTGGRLSTRPLDPEAPLLPAGVAAEAVSYSEWLAVDRHECATAPAGRTRTKLPTAAQMLDIARAG